MRAALQDAETIRDVIQRLGLNVNGGNYRAARGYAAEHGMELPSAGRSVSGKRQSFHNRLPDSEYFCKDKIRNGAHTRNRLIKMGWDYICADCGIGPSWNGKKLTIQVDHINGDRFDNTLSNLRFLCPNCHSQTDTFSVSQTKREPRYSYCQDCRARVHKKSNRCRSCASKMNTAIGKKKIAWPPIDEMVGVLAHTTYTSYAATLGVTDNSVRKHLRRNGIDPKTLNVVE